MRYAVYVITGWFVLLACCRMDTQIPQPTGRLAPVADLFNQAAAEKILGEPAYLFDSTTTRTKGVITYKRDYKARATDTVTGKTGTVYFMLEEYGQASAAHEVYASIKKSNEGHEGISTLTDLGDEAYFHTDGENFYFILARKGTGMIRMKVNKITTHTSRDEFNRVAQEIVGVL